MTRAERHRIWLAVLCTCGCTRETHIGYSGYPRYCGHCRECVRFRKAGPTWISRRIAALRFWWYML